MAVSPIQTEIRKTYVRGIIEAMQNIRRGIEDAAARQERQDIAAMKARNAGLNQPCRQGWTAAALAAMAAPVTVAAWEDGQVWERRGQDIHAITVWAAARQAGCR